MKTTLRACVDGISDFLIGWRHALAVLFLAMTVVFGWSATRVQLDPGFMKQIPIHHPYMQTMMDHIKHFSGANSLLVNLRWKGKGDIYNKPFFEAMRKATDDVFLIPGVDRTRVSSIFTPNTYYIEITEDGFKGEPVVPARFSATPEQLARVRHNVSLSGQVGLLVSNDYKSALIRADLQEVDTGNPAEAEIFYRRVIRNLADIRGQFESPHEYVYTLKQDHPPFKAGQEIDHGYVDYGWSLGMQAFYERPPGGGEPIKIKGSELDVKAVANPDYNPDVEVNIIGFAQLLGDVINGLVGVFAFFAVAFVITMVLLFLYSRSLRLTLVALIVALLPVLWLLGILPMIGFGIDPMSILVPFLIFSIGVSHAVQMTNAWRHEVVRGATAVDASRAAFRKLFIPGAVALLTNALGFAVIMFIDIPIVHELGITACLGVLLMIVTNKMILPIILTHIRLEQRSRENSLKPPSTRQMAIWKQMARCAQPRFALGVFAVCLVLLFVTTHASRGLVIGDTGTGAPELRPTSRYNHDNGEIANHYNIGTDVLSVIVEAPDFAGDSCLHYPVMNLIDQFELYMRGVQGVRSVTSVAGIGKLVIGAFNEGNPRWRALPRSEVGLSTGSKAFDPALGLNTESCRAIQVLVFMKNHEGATIAHAVDQVKDFIKAHPVDGVRMRLASGNVGVMAATNEAVESAEAKMLLAIFGALALLCLLTFRSWRATLCVLVPLTMVSIFCNALMATMDIGLKVATLPVVALGVGVGVDYGIYLFERIQHYLRDGQPFGEAFREAMLERGTAAVFTAITMAIGVGTWTFSALKFQADMGLLLSFMFLVNMLGAICLLPALGAWLFRERAAPQPKPAPHRVAEA
ncbi:efflux RND transporter permease subunit [Solimonas marina]|uniref:MMPL family transporter n=1 Tax=Solimonas marina TaxID=2714601 RepID=A0A969W9P9_9GAMM|nr:efflux RND transporter permease subunit [Solimonas marina]NKF20925.1 MMPL family transporter [Solimonas marina]